MSSERMGSFLREVSNWYWDEFCRAEHDPKYTSNEAMIFGLIRSCAMEKMDAIKMSLHRIDGKPKTPIKIEMPKVFYLYPNAKLVIDHPIEIDGKQGFTTKPVAELPQPKIIEGELILPEQPHFDDGREDDELPSLSLRQTLGKMSDYPRELPQQITELALLIEQSLRGQGEMPDEIPRVKSVVAAHLLILAQKRDIGALSEVFDQIDGKLAETLQLIGEDIYITSFSDVAPPNAYLNADGVVEAVAEQSQLMWADKLGKVGA